jgi:hypothetical protein
MITYPTTLVKAYRYLNEYKVKSSSHASTPATTSDNAVAFAQTKDEKEFPDWMKDKTCFKCGREDHVSNVCPYNDEDIDNETAVKEKKSTGDKKAKRNKKKDKEKSTKQKAMKDKAKKTSFAQVEDESDESSDEDDGSMFCNVDTKEGIPKKKGVGKLNLQAMMLLDSQSTTDLFCNRDFVTGINKVKERVSLRGNGRQ